MEDHKKYHFRNKISNKFEEKTVNCAMIIDGTFNIFDKSIINKFYENKALFVYVNREFKGVIHFSDYNNSVVNFYLYKSIFMYENTLRSILVLEFIDSDMIKYFDYKANDTSLVGNKRDTYKRKINTYNKNISENSKIPLFQSFDIDDLMGLIDYEHIIDINEDERNSITGLRNKVMHSKELINQSDISANNFIYNFDIFEIFFKATLLLQKHLMRARNRLRLLQQIK